MYIYHDRLKDNYKAFTTLTALSNAVGIPYDTLMNHFSRDKLKRYTTKKAEVIVKTPLIKSKRKLT